MKKKEKIIGTIVITVIAAVFISVGYINSSSKKISEKDMEAMFVDEENSSSKSEDVSQKKKNISSANTSSEPSSENSSSAIINVEIKGEVKKPDVYKMNSGNIVNDLIKKSGGAKDDADMSSINRAAKLIDNQCIVIPKKGEKSAAILNNDNLNSSTGDVSQGDSQGDLININTADKEELKKLSGIGDGKAQKIIDYREEHGLFKSIDDIKNVSGIGDATFNNIKNKITVQ